LHKKARYKTQQAVIECGGDAKTVQRRGGVFTVVQNPEAPALTTPQQCTKA
jgi:hypothetical protein